ncbi:hypothetical protein ACUSIJ_07330 [Pseudochelatococcus sp. B33]
MRFTNRNEARLPATGWFHPTGKRAEGERPRNAPITAPFMCRYMIFAEKRNPHSAIMPHAGTIARFRLKPCECRRPPCAQEQGGLSPFRDQFTAAR